MTEEEKKTEHKAFTPFYGSEEVYDPTLAEFENGKGEE